MVRKVIRRRGRPKVIVHYKRPLRQAAVEGPAPSKPAAWEGQRVPIEDLPEFKAKHGLVTVGGCWPDGEPCPRLFFAEPLIRGLFDLVNDFDQGLVNRSQDSFRGLAFCPTPCVFFGDLNSLS